jgi:hypothetical protein
MSGMDIQKQLHMYCDDLISLQYMYISYTTTISLPTTQVPFPWLADEWRELPALVLPVRLPVLLWRLIRPIYDAEIRKMA